MDGISKMLNLDYIIIAELPKEQRKILLENLELEGRDAGNTAAGMPECVAFESHLTGEELRRFPAERSLLISGDGEELALAAELGMAALGFCEPGAEAAGTGEVCALSVASDGKWEGCEPGAEADGTGESCAPGVESDCAGEGGEPGAEVEGTGKSCAPEMYAEGFEEIGLPFLRRVYERHHHLPWTILETERCVVKEFSMKYLDALFELYAGEGMTDYIEPLYPYEQEKEYQSAYIDAMYRFYGYGMWIVCEKRTGKLIGRAGIDYREELGGEPELGYVIGVPYQRQGYATEVCRAILAYAKEELDMASISCLIEEGNTVSEYFAGRLGFSFREILKLDGKRMEKYTRDL